MIEIIKYIITAAAMCGTFANSLKKRWCFVIWGATNTFWCVYFVGCGDYAPALLYAFNLIMAIVGFVSWGRKKSKPAKDIRKFAGYYKRGKCPSCNAEITNVAGTAIADVNYCADCGQCVDWEENYVK